MTSLTTHILDTTHGKPASGVAIRLFKIEGEQKILLNETMTNSDGRTNEPMLKGDDFLVGQYELEFAIGDYFRQRMELAEPPFLDVVPVRFGIADSKSHYHVPLLASPFGFSTYRGS